MSDGKVTPLLKRLDVRLSPTNNRVLRLLERAYRKAGREPVQAYGDLVSAAVLAGRFLNLSPDVMAEHLQKFAPQADLAIRNRPYIFGGAANDA